MKFFLKMNPPTVTAQERKVAMINGKPIFYKPANVKKARAEIIMHLKRYRPKEALTGALELNVVWLFPKTGGGILQGFLRKGYDVAIAFKSDNIISSSESPIRQRIVNSA